MKNVASIMQQVYLLAWLSGPTTGAHNAHIICIPENTVIKVLHGPLMHLGETVTDL